MAIQYPPPHDSESALWGRHISHSLFCSRCGYSLRTLPYIGQCPECGQEYDADALRMVGIFVPRLPRFPLGSVLGLVISLGVSIWLIARSLSPLDTGPFYVGVLLGALAVFFAGHLLTRFREYWHTLEIVARIRKHERDDDAE